MRLLSRRSFGALAFAGAVRGQRKDIEEQVVFAAGEGGYHTYRIPALLVTAKGTALAFAEGRKYGRGDSGAIDMVVKHSEDGGESWSKPSVVWSDGGNTCGNPCPVVERESGRILLPMTWNRGEDSGKGLHGGPATCAESVGRAEKPLGQARPAAGSGEASGGENTRASQSRVSRPARAAEDCQGTRRVFLTSSGDDGRTWAPAREITAEAKDPSWWWYATGPGVSIQVERGPHAGRIVVPANHSSAKNGYAAHTIYSDDAGETWRRSNPIAPACNESQVVELSDGRLMMNMRSQSFTSEERTGYRSIAFSSDGGATWTAPEFDAHLGDPQVQASLIRYSWPEEPGGGRLLFANPSPPIRPERGKRVRMTVRLSRDDGRTWVSERLIHEGPSGYSSLARLPDGRVGLLYEGGERQAYEEIRLARFSLRTG